MHKNAGITFQMPLPRPVKSIIKVFARGTQMCAYKYESAYEYECITHNGGPVR